MRSAIPRPTNSEKMEQIRAAMAEILAGVLKEGFHGTAALELTVQDGTIQHIRRKVEQLER
ncbi:MAG: hypothetical protein GXX96_07845 [Planctomycetaceae bacterium]|nr:hypothetical protein [Planctomycetaceae bacterium]